MDNQNPGVSPTQGPDESDRQLSSSQPNVGHAHKFIYGYLILIIVVAVMGGVYSWQHNKVKNLSKQIDTLNSQVVSLQGRVQTLQKATSSSVSTTTSNTKPSSSSTSSSTTLNVPELGIEIVNIPTTLSGLMYSYVPPNSSNSYKLANFTTSSLINLDASCSGIGSLEVNTGTYNTQTNQGVSKFVKQMSGFWVSFVTESSPCSQTTSVVDLQTSQIQAFSDLVTNPSNIQ